MQSVSHRGHVIRKTASAVLLLIATAAAGEAQTQRWQISYDRMTSVQIRQHGPRQPVIESKHSRLVLTSKGDSVTGQLFAVATLDDPEFLIGDVRGKRSKNELTLSITKPF